LRQLELNVVTFWNLILMPFPGFKVALIVEEGEGSKMAAHVRTLLGEVLMVDQARELLASRKDGNSALKVEFDDDGSLWVTWSREFDGAVDTKGVLEAFHEQLGVAYETQRVVSEECYFSAESVDLIKQNGGRY
jgi:hypothetical protein